MQINIRTSERNQDVVRRLTTKLPYGTKENVIARIALGYSLQTGKKFQTADFNLYDSKGKEYKDHILFDAKYRDFFIALICQYYGLYKTDDSIFQDNYNYTFFDFLVEYIEKGTLALTDLNVSLDAVRNNHQHIEKSFYANPIKIQVGKNLINENLFNICLLATSCSEMRINICQIEI